jgi:hypothetical protein
VARSINDVNLVVFPVRGNSSGGNGNTAFAFLFHPVGYGSTFVHFANFVNFSGVVQNPLGGSGFTGVNVRGNPDIADSFKWGLSGHGLNLVFLYDEL